MRRARITYPGAFHHGMNRGINGLDIFHGNQYKSLFLDTLAETSKKLKVKILAYCVMDNHYHLILENSSGKMSEFMKRLNGLYAMYYRKIEGGTGYVFQGRFKSTLIDRDSYLVQSILYLLQNPVRAGIVQDAAEYLWSSVKSYFSNCSDDIIEAEFVNELFGSKDEFRASLYESRINGLPVRSTRYGDILGSEDFFKSAIIRYDRRNRPTDQSDGSQRVDDRYFESVEKVIWEFEKQEGLKIDEINVTTHPGKHRRGDLLVMLKDKAGLTYKEISKFEIFGDIQLVSLRSMYRNVRKR
ncbi:MAG: transposase [Candidatus Aminicenantes bacterium]|nr:transposase [Candidatus Aminicenantes bacterium]